MPLEKLDKSGTDFFSVFVRNIIEREANEKWLDRVGQGEFISPLLTVEEHCELLSSVALTMWGSKVEYLTNDHLELAIELFNEDMRKNSHQIQQIQKRILGHALLVLSQSAANAVQFDHDEFRLFFLGEGIAQQIRLMDKRAKADIWGVFRRGILPLQAQQALIRAISRNNKLNRLQVVQFFLDVATMDVQASYTQHNCSDVVIHMLSELECDGLEVKNMAFGSDALRDKKLSGINFIDCYFPSSSLELTNINKCKFINCNFDKLSLFNSTTIEQVKLDNCKVESLELKDQDYQLWMPSDIQAQLQKIGFSAPIPETSESTSGSDPELDQNLRDMDKILRYFMRSTHIGENVILIKLGHRGKEFIEYSLPKLIDYGVLEEIDNRGGTNQRRFRLGISLRIIHEAITLAKGSFENFLEHITNHSDTQSS